MKRRQFITTSAGFAAGALCPLTAIAGSPAFLDDPYYDNKVVRVYDPEITDYRFGGTEVYWRSLKPDVLRRMLNNALLNLTKARDIPEAWKLILQGAATGSLNDSKVAIKVNFNNTIRDINLTLNNSPLMLATLAKSLMSAGIQEDHISFFDCSRPFPETYKNEVRSFGLPELGLFGRGDHLPESGQTIFLSDNEGYPRDGKPAEQYPVPAILTEADFLLNLHLVKIHQTGVTGAMKNLFGISKIVGFYMHHPDTIPFQRGNQLTDISLNEEIRKRARLNIAEFIFGGHTPDTIDRFTNEDFYPRGIPASLILSRSPFYHDTVLYDFIRAEYLTCAPVLERFHSMGPDLWLKNAANRFFGWNYERASYNESKLTDGPRRDLYYKNIDYITI